MTTSGKTSEALKRWVLGWIPFWLYSISVFHRAILSPDDIPSFFDRFNDKLMHGAEYFILFLISAHAFQMAESRWLASRPRLSAFIYTAVMGLITEYSERFIEGRACSLADFAADLGGGGAAWVVLALAARCCGSRQKVHG